MLTSSLHGRFSPPTALAQMPPDGGRRGPKSPAVLATSTSISAIAHAVIRSMIYYMRPKLGETNPQNARCGMLCVVLAWPCVMDADCRFFSFFFWRSDVAPGSPRLQASTATTAVGTRPAANRANSPRPRYILFGFATHVFVTCSEA